MEQDTGSGVDPAATSSMLDEQPAPYPAEAASAEAEPASAEAEAAELAEELTATGEPRVDAALRRLGELDGLPVSEHPRVYERIHGQLVEVLGELHSGTGSAGQAAR